MNINNYSVHGRGMLEHNDESILEMQHETIKTTILHQRYVVDRLCRGFNRPYSTVDWKQIKPKSTVTFTSFTIGATGAACGACWQQWGVFGTVVWACFFFGQIRVSFGRTKLTVLHHVEPCKICQFHKHLRIPRGCICDMEALMPSAVLIVFTPANIIPLETTASGLCKIGVPPVVTLQGIFPHFFEKSSVNCNSIRQLDEQRLDSSWLKETL